MQGRKSSAKARREEENQMESKGRKKWRGENRCPWRTFSPLKMADFLASVDISNRQNWSSPPKT
jgi:hypothetical protein